MLEPNETLRGLAGGNPLFSQPMAEEEAKSRSIRTVSSSDSKAGGIYTGGRP